MFVFSLSFGQNTQRKGELILKNGDILIGNIRLPIFQKASKIYLLKEKIEFEKKREGAIIFFYELVRYGEKEVEKVVFRNSNGVDEIYEYIQISKRKKRLFKINISGKAILYSRTASVSSGKDVFNKDESYSYYDHNQKETSNYGEYYVLFEGEHIAKPLIKAKLFNPFKKRALEYFSSCPSLETKLENKIYKRENIYEIINQYNECQ
jgi:hypothetical protein